MRVINGLDPLFYCGLAFADEISLESFSNAAVRADVAVSITAECRVADYVRQLDGLVYYVAAAISGADFPVFDSVVHSFV